MSAQVPCPRAPAPGILSGPLPRTTARVPRPRAPAPGIYLGPLTLGSCSRHPPGTTARSPAPGPLPRYPDLGLLCQASARIPGLRPVPEGPRAASPRAPRPLTRYLPSGENLQSRLESLNTSEKFMAAADPGPANVRAGRTGATATSAAGSDEDGSKAQPIMAPGAARHCGACSSRCYAPQRSFPPRRSSPAGFARKTQRARARSY